ATRFTNTCPMLWSNSSSTGTRESAHASTEANGSCFSAVFCLRYPRSSSSDVMRCSTKRRLPSISCLRAASGVSVDCAKAEREAAANAAAPKAAPARPPRRRPRRDNCALFSSPCPAHGPLQQHVLSNVMSEAPVDADVQPSADLIVFHGGARGKNGG